MVVRIFALVVLFMTMISCGRMSEDEIWMKVEESKKRANHKETLQWYQTLLEKYPESQRTPEILWKAGTTCSNELKDYSSAVIYYKQFISRFPDHRDAPTALFLTGFFYNNEIKNVDSARAYYSEFLRQYPANDLAASVKFELDNLGKESGNVIPNSGKKTTAKKSR
jgi:outer membrane protein assembly factor BamD (BamD/ComL family)